ncbi:MAG: cation transporter [Oscillospiraceae bacterium]|nr:cation transporter [Oscillospiraceae bacterium]
MTKLLLRLFVKEYKDPTSAAVRGRVGKLSGVMGIVCNLLLFVFKIVVGTISGAVSITADAMNNLSDATSAVVTLVGFKLAEKPADADHPYGHARYEYLSGLAVAGLIVVIGFELAKASVEKILHPAEVLFSLPVCIVLVLSVLVKLWMGMFNRYLGKYIQSTTLLATAADSRNDAISTTAVLVAGILGTAFGWKIDGWMGLAVALFILYSGAMLAKETISPLLGENASPELREQIATLVSSVPEVLGYHDLMVHDYGPGQRFASMHVEMDQSADPLTCHELIDNLERACLQQLSVHLIIHYDPVVTGDEEMDRLRAVVQNLLRQQDQRIGIHDFRMVRGQGHSNLIFDAELPAELMLKQQQVKQKLDEDLASCEPGTYYTVITFDMGAPE